jgi:hypothetical protein
VAPHVSCKHELGKLDLCQFNVTFVFVNTK